MAQRSSFTNPFRRSRSASPSGLPNQSPLQEDYSSTYSDSRKNWKFPFPTLSRTSPSHGVSTEEGTELLLREVESLRAQVTAQDSAVIALQQQLHTKQFEVQQLEEQWNLQNFKYKLLVDMWAMRVLDNEELGGDESTLIDAQQRGLHKY